MHFNADHRIVALAWSKNKGTRKKSAQHLELVENYGVSGDAHAGPWHRQVSFLSAESIDKTREQGLDVGFGDFAENIATRGIDWRHVSVGTRVKIGETAVVEITQIGKECHRKCAIFYQAGDCIMPKEGVFGRVLQSGTIHVGDAIELLAADSAGPPPTPSPEQFKARAVDRWNMGDKITDILSLIAEEPLSIRVQGKPYTVVMRTPGEEVAHAAGFCLSEGLIDVRGDYTAIGVCEGENRNVVTITLTAERMLAVADRLDRRQLISQTSCGICGKEIVEDLHQLLAPIPDGISIPMADTIECIEHITEYQILRLQTKASHAAVMFDGSCKMIASAEDVGRHNALDKTVGKLFLADRLKEARLLILSSRISYEMVQKAARAKVPVVLALSRPTDLAIQLARELNMTLGCMEKNGELLVFTAPQRLSG